MTDLEHQQREDRIINHLETMKTKLAEVSALNAALQPLLAEHPGDFAFLEFQPVRMPTGSQQGTLLSGWLRGVDQYLARLAAGVDKG